MVQVAKVVTDVVADLSEVVAPNVVILKFQNL